jgi:hypothetical protein
MMDKFVLVYPMFAMVLITVIVLAKLFRSRVRAVRDGEIPALYFKTYQGEIEPDSTAKLSRHFKNIFEAPTLFYIVCLAAMLTGLTSVVFLSLAWCYVATRAIHAFIHIGRNRIYRRISVYFLSWIFLLTMWVYLTVSVAMTTV